MLLVALDTHHLEVSLLLATTTCMVVMLIWALLMTFLWLTVDPFIPACADTIPPSEVTPESTPKKSGGKSKGKEVWKDPKHYIFLQNKKGGAVRFTPEGQPNIVVFLKNNNEDKKKTKEFNKTKNNADKTGGGHGSRTGICPNCD